MSDDQSRSGEDGETEGDVEGPGTAGGPAGIDEGGPDRGERDEDEEWQFSLSDIEEREAENGDDTGSDGGDHRAPESNSTPIVRGTPSMENAAFVVLGMLVMVAVLFRLVAAGVGV